MISVVFFYRVYYVRGVQVSDCASESAKKKQNKLKKTKQTNTSNLHEIPPEKEVKEVLNKNLNLII